MNTTIITYNHDYHPPEDALNAAMNLTPCGLKIYLYMYAHEVGTEEEFTTRNFVEKLGLSKPSVPTAMKELQEKGYLRKIEENQFIFFPNPKCNYSTHSNSITNQPTTTQVSPREKIDVYKYLPREDNFTTLRDYLLARNAFDHIDRLVNPKPIEDIWEDEDWLPKPQIKHTAADYGWEEEVE